MGKPRKSHPSLPQRKSSRPKRPSLRFPSSEWHLDEEKLKHVNNLAKKAKDTKNIKNKTKKPNSKKTEKLQAQIGQNVDDNMIMNQQKKVANDTEVSLEADTDSEVSELYMDTIQAPSIKSPHTDHMNVISPTTSQGSPGTSPSNSDENRIIQSHIKEEPRYECEEEIQIVKEINVHPRFQTLAQTVATVKPEIQVQPHKSVVSVSGEVSNMNPTPGSPSTHSDLFQPQQQSNQRNLTGVAGQDVDASVDSPVPSHLCNERGDGAGLEKMSEVAASSGELRGVGGCDHRRQSDSVKIKMEIEISTRQFIEIGRELPGFLAAANVNNKQ